MTTQEILAKLGQCADPAYLAFNKRIVFTHYPMLGVRAPALQSLAKEIANGPDLQSFLEGFPLDTYENVLLYALAVAKAKMPLAQKLPYVDKAVDKFDNWAHVDMMLGAFSQLKKEAARDAFWAHCEKYEQWGTYHKRVLAVFLMDYCLCEPLLDRVFAQWQRLQGDDYYVNMAVAWGLSVALVKFFDPTLKVLKSGKFNADVVKKAAQKGRDSRRLTPAQKALL